jgi:hypothetical protein
MAVLPAVSNVSMSAANVLIGIANIIEMIKAENSNFI